MKVLLLVSCLALAALAGSSNIQPVGMTGESLMDEMQKDDNKDIAFVIQFKKINVNDKALMAANDNQKEGVINKINALDQLDDDQKARFQVVEVNDANKVLMRKWKVKESAADKRPVFLVAKGGVGKTFSGPLATQKATDYFDKIKADASGDEAADTDEPSG